MSNRLRCGIAGLVSALLVSTSASAQDPAVQAAPAPGPAPAATAPSPLQPATEQQAPEPAPKPKRSVGPFILLGAGGVSVLCGLALTGMASSEDSSAKAQRSAGSSLDSVDM